MRRLRLGDLRSQPNIHLYRRTSDLNFDEGFVRLASAKLRLFPSYTCTRPVVLLEVQIYWIRGEYESRPQVIFESLSLSLSMSYTQP